jgi:hypothetical protein
MHGSNQIKGLTKQSTQSTAVCLYEEDETEKRGPTSGQDAQSHLVVPAPFIQFVSCSRPFGTWWVPRLVGESAMSPETAWRPPHGASPRIIGGILVAWNVAGGHRIRLFRRSIDFVACLVMVVIAEAGEVMGISS